MTQEDAMTEQPLTSEEEREPGSRRFRDLLRRERQDMAWLVHVVAALYDEISGGRISKPMTYPHHVIEAFGERLQESYDSGKADAEAEYRLALPLPEHDDIEALLAAELVDVVRHESEGRVLNLSVEDRARRWAVGIARKLAASSRQQEAGIECPACKALHVFHGHGRR